ncbi:hypothetical protein [Bacillus sp. XF8]|uniref:hypothetical protein n=1 Tax=Bacillus sp. XF8 TaxID=2819289 RepID=UPI001AA021AB|nr:hypothetical protein [Bacillus sp. XF8]MBO1582705.1 hypothetical protein [Bacillus sp. XF8]
MTYEEEERIKQAELERKFTLICNICGGKDVIASGVSYGSYEIICTNDNCRTIYKGEG